VRSACQAVQSASKRLATLRDVGAGAIAAARQELAKLRAVAHPRSRAVAEAEDVVAQCLHDAGDDGGAVAASTASLDILRHHYPPGSLALGHEEAKLCMLQRAAGDAAAAVSGASAAQVLRAHYGAAHPRLCELEE